MLSTSFNYSHPQTLIVKHGRLSQSNTQFQYIVQQPFQSKQWKWMFQEDMKK